MGDLQWENSSFEKLRRQILPSGHDNPDDDEMEIRFPTDLIPSENIENILQFFEKVDKLDKNKLLGIFQTVNKINKVDIQNPENAEVARAAEQFVENVLIKVGELDPRFKSSLIHCGSFYDDVKIGKPDEFDFTAKIETLCDSDGLEARFSCSKKGFVYVVVTGTTKLNMFSDFIVEPKKDDALLEHDKILSVNKIQSHFSELIDIALRSVEVPIVLSPSDEEFSWHSISHGPCATVYASFFSKSLGEMTLDIDIAPTFDLPDPKFYPPMLKNESCDTDVKGFRMFIYETLQQKEKIRLVPFTFDKTSRHADGKTWTYEYSNKWRVSFNALEKVIFALYSSDSVEKQLYRVLKAMKDTHIQKSEEKTAKAGTSSMKYEEPPSTRLSSVTAKPLVECVGGPAHTGLTIEPLSVASNHRLGGNGENFDMGATRFSIEAIGEYSSGEEDTSSEEHTSETENSDADYQDAVASMDENRQSNAEIHETEIIYDRLSSISNLNQKPIDFVESDVSGKRISDKTKDTLYDRASSPPRLSHPENTKNTDQIITGNILSEEKRQVMTTIPSSKAYISNIKSYFESTTEYRSSKPLIKTYHIKMILFSMKLVFEEEEIWDIENLPFLVMIVIKALYYIYSSKQRAFNSFWFQEIIENSERPSICLEILQSLEDLVEELDRKTRPVLISYLT